MWILTRSHNDYNQYGEYFVDAFKSKPSNQNLRNALDEDEYVPGWIRDETVEKLIADGGGREGNADVWYDLHQIK